MSQGAQSYLHVECTFTPVYIFSTEPNFAVKGTFILYIRREVKLFQVTIVTHFRALT